MNNIIVRVKRLLDKIEMTYTDLEVVSKSYGYSVFYVDSLGDRQTIDIYVLAGTRTSYVVRWVSNGNMKLRLPA